MPSCSGHSTSDAVGPSYNPLFPTIPIGNDSPLVGARPFRRPPHTGFAGVTYSAKHMTIVATGAFSSRSDDSTFLGGEDVNFGNTLLLPNRNLDHGYAKLDLGGTFNINSWLEIYAQADNLLSQQHITPIGYMSLPFNARVGLRFTLDTYRKTSKERPRERICSVHQQRKQSGPGTGHSSLQHRRQRHPTGSQNQPDLSLPELQR